MVEAAKGGADLPAGFGGVHDRFGGETLWFFQNRDREGAAPLWCRPLCGRAPRLRSGF